MCCTMTGGARLLHLTTIEQECYSNIVSALQVNAQGDLLTQPTNDLFEVYNSSNDLVVVKEINLALHNLCQI